MVDALDNHVDDDEGPGPSDARGTMNDDGPSVRDRCLFGANIHEETQHPAWIAGHSVVGPYSEMVMPVVWGENWLFTHTVNVVIGKW